MEAAGAIREFYLAQQSAVSELRRHVAEFESLEHAGLREEHLYHRVLSIVHQICASILSCEEAALTRDEILEVLDPVRRIHARSPEAYALSRAIAQQHRNKVHHQATRIMRTLLSNPGNTRIASLACGSCPDLRAIADHLPALAGELWLNDIDDGAIEFSAAALKPIRERCHFRRGDALSVARNLQRGAFDLVLAGGLFDYLEPRPATVLLKIAYNLLSPGGTFFFTNIAEGNPYRPLIEYFGNWRLIERSREDILEFCDAAGIPRSNVTIRREETGLALLIEVAKLQ